MDWPRCPSYNSMVDIKGVCKRPVSTNTKRNTERNTKRPPLLHPRYTSLAIQMWLLRRQYALPQRSLSMSTWPNMEVVDRTKSNVINPPAIVKDNDETAQLLAVFHATKETLKHSRPSMFLFGFFIFFYFHFFFFFSFISTQLTSSLLICSNLDRTIIGRSCTNYRNI